MTGAAVLGDRQRAPSIGRCSSCCASPTQHVIANLLGLALAGSAAVLALQPLCHRTPLARTGGSCHWIVVDEAHHLAAPAAWDRPARHAAGAGRYVADRRAS